ncbi:MAG: TonB-dependent receptor [Paracoccus sp. (in: a-proteobacteria)]|uniref:TonB-dependent receptor domain-containing protein n=1 Tax=Paracoccus sp. TaxID=267 RepID=UPI0026E01A6A|nr:TonB-dependent receptor [Paracoccus sp. (in: a-proteobacteria)]MDO5631588.1 TonB-dependent receptor [Paracoccus sp. (in: a-proteobacteria)]
MRKRLTLIPFILGAIPAGTLAQERPTVLDPIILRAGTEKVASDVPQSVSVVGQQELDDTAPGTIGQALTQVPGVAGVGSSSFFGQGFNIRGFGSSGTAASEAGIVQLIDGERKYYESYRQGSLFVEPDFLTRIEVLRGPGSSTLYGAGALGGVIAMETVSAGDLIAEGATQGGRLRLRYGSNPDTAFASALWGWRPTADFEAVAGLAYRHLGDTKDPDGDVMIRSNSDAPNLLLKARQRFGDHYIEGSYLHLEARGDDQDFNQLEGAQVGLFPGFTGWGVGDILTRDQTARLVWGYNPENPLIDSTVTLSYTNTIKDIRQGSNPDEPIMDSLLGRRDYGLWKLRAQNVADVSAGGWSHFVTIGAETSYQDRTSTAFSASHPEAVTRHTAVFAWSELSRDRLTINTGLRWTRQNTSPRDSVTVTDEDVRNTAAEPQISVMYDLTDNWSVFGSAAKVSRLPNVDELYDSFRGGAASPDLKAERGKNLELGVSYRKDGLFSADDQARVKLTLFRNHIDDMIVRTNAPPPTPSYTNIDRAYLRGGEVEAVWSNTAWQLGAAVSVVNGHDQDGNTLDTLPNNRLALSATWRPSDEWRLGLRSTLAAGRDKPDGTRRAGYGVHDVFAVWSPQSGVAQGTEFGLAIDNILNREYVPATYQTGPAPGRNVSLTLTRNF